MREFQDTRATRFPISPRPPAAFSKAHRRQLYITVAREAGHLILQQYYRALAEVTTRHMLALAEHFGGSHRETCFSLAAFDGTPPAQNYAELAF